MSGSSSSEAQVGRRDPTRSNRSCLHAGAASLPKTSKSFLAWVELGEGLGRGLVDLDRAVLRALDAGGLVVRAVPEGVDTPRRDRDRAHIGRPAGTVQTVLGAVDSREFVGRCQRDCDIRIVRAGSTWSGMAAAEVVRGALSILTARHVYVAVPPEEMRREGRFAG